MGGGIRAAIIRDRAAPAPHHNGIANAMSSRLLSALVASLAALAAPVRAQAPQAPATYAVVSLIGDQLDAVTYQPQVGTLLDANSHQAMPMGADIMDNLALRETNKALRSAVPVTDVALLAVSAPEFFIDESRLFAGNQVKLPADIDAAIAQAKAGSLVLITKHRADARLQVSDGLIGSGKIEGLGFYVDTVHHLRDAENTRATGFLAPFVYIDVTLVDTASHTIIGQKTITASETVTANSNETGAGAWGALTTEQKMSTLSRLLSKNLAAAVPKLLQPAASGQPPAGTPAG